MFWAVAFVLVYMGIASWLAYALAAFVQDFKWDHFGRLLKLTLFWFPILLWLLFDAGRSEYYKRKYGVETN